MKTPDKSFILMVLAAILALAGTIHSTPVYAAELTRAQKQYLKEKGTVIFVSQTHYPPFEFVGRDGDHTGMCIELIRWIATEFGFKAHFTDTSFKQAQKNILAGKADVLTSFFYSKQRDRTFDFTQPLFDVPASIFVDALRPDIKGIFDLDGKIVAMQEGDYAKEFIESKNIKCTFKYTQNFAQAIDLVVKGQADAVIGDGQIVLFHIYSTHLTKKIKKVGAPLYIGENCMGFKEPGGMLRQIMDVGIERAQTKGILDQINRKWLGTTYSQAPSQIQKIFWVLSVLLGAATLIGLFVWTWNLNLRQKVAARTADLVKSKKTLRIILDASPLGIGLTEGQIIKWCNPAMCRMLGYESGELIDKKIDMIYQHPDLSDTEQCPEKTGYTDGADTCFETQWIRKGGTRFDCRLRRADLRLEDRSMTVVIAEDITGQKQAENKIKDSLKEKEMLLREIHHRVKNNMQVVSSLLSLQEDRISTENALLAFKDSQNRIQSIALVHEVLYQSQNLSQIHIKTYLDELINYIQPAYTPEGCRVKITNKTDDTILKIDHATPFGLIASELLINAMKYGSIPGKNLHISITASCLSDHTLQVKIADNGPGIAPDFNLKEIETLGLKLVIGLIEDQLEGEFHLEETRGQGTCWVIEWPIPVTENLSASN